MAGMPTRNSVSLPVLRCERELAAEEKPNLALSNCSIQVSSFLWISRIIGKQFMTVTIIRHEKRRFERYHQYAHISR
jgi:hypothetical protein